MCQSSFDQSPYDNMDNTEEACFNRYCKVSPTRLLIYGVSSIALLVIVILCVTLLPGKGGMDSPLTGSEVLQKIPLIDGNNHLASKIMTKLSGAIASSFPFNTNLEENGDFKWCKTDLPRMKQGHVDLQALTVSPTCDSQYRDSVAKTIQQIDLIKRLVGKYNDFKLITSHDSVGNNFDEKKIGVFIGIEGGHAIDNKLSVLRTYHDLGVRYITINGECDNTWASSAYKALVPENEKKTEKPELTLTEFGKLVIKEMNRLGIMIDLTHSSKDTQIAVMRHSSAPVIFSSTASYQINSRPGNIDDNTLDILKSNGGLVMISFDGNRFGNESYASSMNDVVEHINYVSNKIGIDHIGLGSGFHRSYSKSVIGLEDSSKYPDLFDRLAKPRKNGNERKWTPDELKKLASENFLRVWKAVEEVSTKKSKEISDESLIPKVDIPENSCTTEL